MEDWQEALQEMLAAETRRRAEAEAAVQEISLYNSAILEQAQVRIPFCCPVPWERPQFLCSAVTRGSAPAHRAVQGAWAGVPTSAPVRIWGASSINPMPTSAHVRIWGASSISPILSPET